MFKLDGGSKQQLKSDTDDSEPDSAKVGLHYPARTILSTATDGDNLRLNMSKTTWRR
jgi:hypothetical protein